MNESRANVILNEVKNLAITRTRSFGGASGPRAFEKVHVHRWVCKALRLKVVQAMSMRATQNLIQNDDVIVHPHGITPAELVPLNPSMRNRNDDELTRKYGGQ